MAHRMVDCTALARHYAVPWQAPLSNGPQSTSPPELCQIGIASAATCRPTWLDRLSIVMGEQFFEMGQADRQHGAFAESPSALVSSLAHPWPFPARLCLSHF